jgi:plastocyanin
LVAAGGAALLAGPARAAQTVKVRVPAAKAAFEPAEVRIKVGDTVEWTNRSIVAHTVTCDPAKAKTRTNVNLPAGAEAFDSGALEQDQTFTHLFPVAGTYKYVCLEHEAMGMVATVVVER